MNMLKFFEVIMENFRFKFTGTRGWPSVRSEKVESWADQFCKRTQIIVIKLQKSIM